MIIIKIAIFILSLSVCYKELTFESHSIIDRIPKVKSIMK